MLELSKDGMDGSTDEGLPRGFAGDRVVDLADHHVVRTDLEPQAGTPGVPTPAGLHVRRVDRPAGVVLFLRGELDVATVPTLQEHLDRAVRGGGTVVIDLAGLGFIDPNGLAVLVRAEQRLRASGGQLVLLGGSRAVYRAFELAGLDRHFEWSDSPGTQSAAERAGEHGGVRWS